MISLELTIMHCACEDLNNVLSTNESMHQLDHKQSREEEKGTTTKIRTYTIRSFSLLDHFKLVQTYTAHTYNSIFYSFFYTAINFQAVVAAAAATAIFSILY